MFSPCYRHSTYSQSKSAHPSSDAASHLWNRSSSPIIGVSVPNDVYLTYSIFTLTAAMRLTVFPLSLRSETPYLPPSEFAALIITDKKTRSPSPKPPPPTSGPWAEPDNLLYSEVYTIPEILSNPTGLPTYARVSMPPNASAPLVITPETLRYLGKAVEQVTSLIRDVVRGHRVAETRAQLQLHEMQRQRQRMSIIAERVARLRGEKHERTTKKIEALRTSQKAIMARADALLQSMVQRASPELSENESKWFEELRRMKAEVMGVGKYDDRALAARLKLVSSCRTFVLWACLSLSCTAVKGCGSPPPSVEGNERGRATTAAATTCRVAGGHPGIRTPPAIQRGVRCCL